MDFVVEHYLHLFLDDCHGFELSFSWPVATYWTRIKQLSATTTTATTITTTAL